MEPLHEELISLIDENPPIAGRLAGLMRKLQLLERELASKLGGRRVSNELAYSPVPLDVSLDSDRRERAKALTGAWGKAVAAGNNRAYAWTTNSLCEMNKGEERPRLQVNRDDYHSVAKAVAMLIDESGTFSATPVQAAARRVDGSPIPLTQMYLCLRYWRAMKLMDRAAGRRMKIASKITGYKDFKSAATDLSRPARD